MNKVENFMSMLSSQLAPMRKSQRATKEKYDRIPLNYIGAFGRYQIFPVDNVVTNYPYVVLLDTYEISIPKSYKDQETGETKVAKIWVKILPKSGYIMRTQDGNITSSLTKEEEDLLEKTREVFRQLREELVVKTGNDAKDKANYDIYSELIRKRNYTIFNGYCIAYWNESNNGRTPSRELFPALFVSTALGFMDTVEASIRNKSWEEQDETNSWIGQVYNRETTNRTGCIMLTYNKAKAGLGFDVSVNHMINNNNISKITIPEDKMELMQDPLETFLDKQARYEEGVAPENRRLFNAELMNEALEFMVSKLAAIRTAKAATASLGNTDLDLTSIKDVILGAATITNSEAISSTPNAVTTNDPMLKQEEGVSAEQIIANNNAPFQTPPVFHADPTSGAPVNTQQQSSPFSAPSFANSGNSPFSTPSFATNSTQGGF